MIIEPLPDNVEPQEPLVFYNPAVFGVFIDSETNTGLFGSERNGKIFVQAYDLNRFYSVSPDNAEDDSWLKGTRTSDRLTAYTEDGKYDVYFNHYKLGDIVE